MTFCFVVSPLLTYLYPSRGSQFSRRATRLRDGGVGTAVCLNRVLFEQHEVDKGCVDLPENDFRASHVLKVLRLQNGGQVQAGVLNHALYDNVNVWYNKQGLVSFNLDSGKKRALPEAPKLTLLLAIPRPKVLARLLPQITAIGVHSIVLLNAYRVERCYFDAKLLRNETLLNDALVTGLMQAGCDARMPTIQIAKRLQIFLEDELDSFAPPDSLRLLAHPGDDIGVLQQLNNAATNAKFSNKHVVLAVGPEGGWMLREVSMFRSLGFTLVDLGRRVVRTDAAVLILMGIVHEWQRTHERQLLHYSKLR